MPRYLMQSRELCFVWEKIQLHFASRKMSHKSLTKFTFQLKCYWLELNSDVAEPHHDIVEPWREIWLRASGALSFLSLDLSM